MLIYTANTGNVFLWQPPFWLIIYNLNIILVKFKYVTAFLQIKSTASPLKITVAVQGMHSGLG